METKPKVLQTQVGGDHYAKYPIQPIEYIHANKLDFEQGNIVKLITRFRDKNGAQDLRKIKHYADILLALEYGEANTAHLREIGLNPAINLKDGEYIPSVGEMYLIYTHLREINAALWHIGGMEIADEWYLTSTEGSAANAWNLHLRNGNLFRWNTKASGKGRVRPVSAFNFSR